MVSLGQKRAQQRMEKAREKTDALFMSFVKLICHTLFLFSFSRYISFTTINFKTQQKERPVF